MSVLIEGQYLGNKICRLLHTPSGAEIITNAPRDNGGEGKAFSPTDLVAGALGACMMTIMGIMADRLRLDLAGTRMSVEKHMQASPRRIARLVLELHLPEALGPEDRKKLEAGARACPVEHSLHSEVALDVKFLYDVAVSTGVR